MPPGNPNLPMRREDGLYTAEELAEIQEIPAKFDSVWGEYAGACRERPDDFFVDGTAQNEVAKLCRPCPVIRQCGQFAVCKAGLEIFGVHGGLTARKIRQFRKEFPWLIWDD